MAWYKIGRTMHSSKEMHAHSGEFMDIAVPTAFTAIGGYVLFRLIDILPFFMVHTTTAKLVYVFAGFFLLCIGYAYRKAIAALVLFAFFGMILLIAGGAFWPWLMA